MAWDGSAHIATKLFLGPVIEPFTLAEAKLHCRIDIDDENPLVANWIRAARTKVEHDTQRALLTQTWDLLLDGFYQPGLYLSDWGWPRYAPATIKLPYPPLQSVTSVNQTDPSGTETVWASTNYVVDTASEPGRIALADSGSWPTGLRIFQPGRIRFVAGYLVPQAIPADLLQAMALLIGWFSENRQPSAMETDVYDNLIAPYEIFQAA